MQEMHLSGSTQAIWPLTEYAPPGNAAGVGRGGRGGMQGPPAPPGEYTFTLHAGGKTYTQKARLVSRAPGDSR